MSPNLKRTLVSGGVFFVLFSALSVFLQYQNPDFTLGGVLTNSVFVTMLYVAFTWLIRRFSDRAPTRNSEE